MTTAQTPILDLFIGPDRGQWRLYVAGSSWCPLLLRDRMNADREIHPVAEPDLEELDRFMFATDAPHSKRVTGIGGVELEARGRSATALLVWLEGIVGPAVDERCE